MSEPSNPSDSSPPPAPAPTHSPTAPAGDPLTDPITPSPKAAEITPAPPSDPKDPAAPPPPDPPKKKDIRDFEPEPFSLDQGSRKPKEETPEPDPKATPPADPKDDPAPEGSSSLLREKVKELNTEKETFAAELATIRTERETLESQLAELRAEKESIASRLKDHEERKGMMDPSQHPDVQKLRTERREFEDQFASRIHRMASDMGGSEGAALWGAGGEAYAKLVKQYESVGQIGDDGYAERHAALKNDLEDTFPESHREVMTALREGSEAFEKAARMARQEEELVKGISSKGKDLQNGELQAQYQQGMEAFTGISKAWLNPDPDLIENSPRSPRVALRKLIDASPETAERWEAIQKVLKKGLAPVAPLSAEQIGAMTDEEVHEQMTARLHERQGALQRLQSNAGEAYLSMAILPSVLAERDDLRRELDELRDGTPQPKDDDDNTPAKGGENKDIRGFVPENDLLDSAFSVRR